MSRQIFVKAKDFLGARRLFNMLVLVFLVGNLVIRFSTIFHYPPYNGYLAAFLGCIVAGCIGIIFFQKFLGAFLFIFGFSFFLFGFPSIDSMSRLFELLVSCFATTLFVVNLKNAKTHLLNKPLVVLLLCYVSLSLFSLLLLPVRQVIKDFWFFGFQDFFFYLFINPPYGFYYPVSGVIRLMLFTVLAVQFSSLPSKHKAYKTIFMGLFSGVVCCGFIGLLDFYGIISLIGYRFGTTTSPGVLHSTFMNRGVLAEFVLTLVPFVLIGFMSKKRRVWLQVLLFGTLVICELVLILAGARAGWVAYPLILFICWLFFYFFKEGRFESFNFKWKHLIKVAISVPVTILISFFLIFQVLMPLSKHFDAEETKIRPTRDARNTSEYVENRIANFTKTGRVGTWHDSINVGAESPIFGVGYESYCWHTYTLGAIPDSYYKQNQIHLEPRLTPHNIFITLFTSGGVVGLGFWLLIVGYAIMILLFDLIRNKRLLNIPVIISIISFHTYGIFQSMQYIPVIWCLIFLNLGYAMTVDEKVLPERVKRVMGVVGKVSILLVSIGFFVYLTNFESRSLAKKYHKRIYAVDQDQDRFGGFFQPTKRWTYGDYRWFGKRGAIRISEERGQRSVVGGGRAIELAFHCRTPGLKEEPVILKVFYDGRVLDEVVFPGDGGVKADDSRRKVDGKKQTTEYTVVRKYELPVTPGEEQELLLEVSRTWIPHEVLRNFDRRELGIGVKVVQ